MLPPLRDSSSFNLRNLRLLIPPRGLAPERQGAPTARAVWNVPESVSEARSRNRDRPLHPHKKERGSEAASTASEPRNASAQATYSQKRSSAVGS